MAIVKKDKSAKLGKKSKSADNSPLFSVAVYHDGYRDLIEPVIVEQSATHLLVNVRRRGSKKRDLHLIPMRDVLYATGAVGVEGAEVRVRSLNHEFTVSGRLVSASAEAFVFKDEDGNVHTVATNIDGQRVEITAELPDADSGSKKKAKKAKAADDAGSSKKKVKVKKAKD